MDETEKNLVMRPLQDKKDDIASGWILLANLTSIKPWHPLCLASLSGRVCVLAYTEFLNSTKFCKINPFETQLLLKQTFVA